MAWHVVTNQSANEKVLRTIADTKGLTTISPTWFTIADTNGNINSLASSQYVNYAHQSNIEVWALVRDFDGGIGSYEESYEVLSYTSKRENLINQLIAEALQTGIDGINVDFEKISAECGEHYIQFIRELSVKCRQNGLVLSVDNYVPKTYNAHYHIEEQGKVADYVIIMGYDEHYSGSYESGSVASLNFVKEGIEATLNAVPKEKVINAVPFFTRLWKEVDLPHGVCNAMLLPIVEEENAKQAPAKFRVMAETIGMDVEGKTDEECMDFVIGKIKELSERVGIPKTLSELGVENPDFETLAENSMKDACAGANPVFFDKELLIKLFKKIA